MRCLPDNPPRSWTLPHLTRAIHTPKLLALLYEVNAMYRQIHIDGRPLPEDPDAGAGTATRPRAGKATRWWSRPRASATTCGSTRGGSPMSDVAKMTERIRRPNYGTLEIELTIDDPKNYTRPFTVNLTQHIELDTELDGRVLSREREVLRADDQSRGK